MAKMKIYIKQICICIFLSLVLFSIAQSSEKSQDQPVSLPKEHVKKLKRIAEIIAGEISNGLIKTVTVEVFTDFKGKPSKIGKAMANEFKKHLMSLAGADFSIVDTGADAVIGGVLVPFKGGDKWKLDIKVVSQDKKIVMSYTGIFKKAKTAKK